MNWQRVVNSVLTHRLSQGAQPKVLFAFAIRLVDLALGWGQKNDRGITVQTAGIFNELHITDADQTRVAQRIWYAAVRKQRL
jgi:hypothetical protein